MIIQSFDWFQSVFLLFGLLECQNGIKESLFQLLEICEKITMEITMEELRK